MIEVQNLTKVYGDTVAVDDVSFEVARGEVVGFVGCNGAGKTTTMRILTSFAAATSGEAYMGGHHVFWDSDEVRRIVGYLPENTPLYKDGRRVPQRRLHAGQLRRVRPDARVGIPDVPGATEGGACVSSEAPRRRKH